MKSTFKRIIIVFGIVLLLLIIFVVSFGFKANTAMKRMTSIDTGEVIDNIYAINDSYVNLFLIKGENKYVAIDCGNKIENIELGLKNLGIESNDIIAIFLTHTDFDHVAAIDIFENAKVYLSKYEEQMINGEHARFFSVAKNKISTSDYSLLDDEQIVIIDGINIQGISNPGHTPGAMSYLITNSYLFTGDALKLEDGRVTSFYEIFNMDSKIANTSINKLMAIKGVEYLFTAHNGYSDDYNLLVAQWSTK
jgi:hydroxyacylglutathione hydrolase